MQHSDREVEIGEIVSNVRVFDSGSVLHPHTLHTIVAAVMRALDERERHAAQVKAERRITQGVRAELEGDL